MQPKELGRSPDDLPVDSPLQRVTLNGTHKDLYLKREDLLCPAGGNKVRRFRAWLDTNSRAHTIAAMSDPGAHTFRVLQSLLDHPRYRNRIRRLVFLETLRPTNFYSRSIRAKYLCDKRIHVMRTSVWLQTMLLKVLGLLPGVASLGIGGHVRLSPNPFSEALEETNRQLATDQVSGTFIHVFPIASGTMLDGFLSSRHRESRNSFVGIMTGHPITRHLLASKYSYNESVTLVPSRPLGWSDYTEKAQRFHAQTGVWLDPVHTIHMLDVLERFSTSADGVVLWITCPFIDSDPVLLEGVV